MKRNPKQNMSYLQFNTDTMGKNRTAISNKDMDFYRPANKQDTKTLLKVNSEELKDFRIKNLYKQQGLY